MSAARQRRRKGLTVLGLVGVLLIMGGLTASAVPLYRLFCQVTGFGGTTQTARAVPAAASTRVMTIRFNADTARDLPWRFEPAQREMQVHVGEPALATFIAVNEGDETIVGTATYNVTPFKVGPYFSKVQCFCFTEQVLAPGEQAEMPVSFFVDPDMVDDANVEEVQTITLSYTFFRARSQEAALATPAVVR